MRRVVSPLGRSVLKMNEGHLRNRGRDSQLLLGNALSAIPLDMYKFRKQMSMA